MEGATLSPGCRRSLDDDEGTTSCNHGASATARASEHHRDVGFQPVAEPGEGGQCQVGGPVLDVLELTRRHLTAVCGFFLRPAFR